MTQHEFRIRFRANEHEDEHHGSLVINCQPTTDCQIKHEVQRIVERVTREHPRAQFDGILYHSPRERA